MTGYGVDSIYVPQVRMMRKALGQLFGLAEGAVLIIAIDGTALFELLNQKVYSGRRRLLSHTVRRRCTCVCVCRGWGV